MARPVPLRRMAVRTAVAALVAAGVLSMPLPAQAVSVAAPSVAAAVAAAPLAVAAVAEESGATLTWRLPASDGGNPITGYVVDVSEDGGTAWRAAPEATGTTARTYTVLGLVDGRTYVFRVAAVTAAGVGAWSSITTAVVPAPTAPWRPTAVTATPSHTRVLVSWQPPSRDGGQPITGYAVQQSTDAGRTWSGAATQPGATATALLVTGLTDGDAYRFRVAARNALGQGAWSSPSAEVSPAAAIPVTAPRGFRVTRTTADPRRVLVSWRPVPGAERYAVDVATGTTATTRVLDLATVSVVVPAPDACSAVKVTVAAIDVAGAEAATGVWRLDALAPGGVRAVQRSAFTAGRGALTWQPPLRGGLGGVTGYRVVVTRVDDGRVLLDGVRTTANATFAGVRAGARYRVQVTARNSFGSCVTSTTTLR